MNGAICFMEDGIDRHDAKNAEMEQEQANAKQSLSAFFASRRFIE